MATYVDPRTGFRISDTSIPEPTPEELEQTLTDRRAARVAIPTPAPVVFSDISQGVRGEPVHSLDQDRLTDHQYFLANKDRILAAFAAGQLN